VGITLRVRAGKALPNQGRHIRSWAQQAARLRANTYRQAPLRVGWRSGREPSYPHDFRKSQKQFRRMPLPEKGPVIHAVTLTTRFFASLRMTLDACGIGKGVLRGQLKRAGDSSPYR